MDIIALISLAFWVGFMALAVYLAIAVQHDSAIRQRMNKDVFPIGHWDGFSRSYSPAGCRQLSLIG